MTRLDEPSPTWPPARVAQWVTVAALLILSEVVSLLGHAVPSWALDVIALGALGGLTLARRAGARTR